VTRTANATFTILYPAPGYGGAAAAKEPVAVTEPERSCYARSDIEPDVSTCCNAVNRERTANPACVLFLRRSAQPRLHRRPSVSTDICQAQPSPLFCCPAAIPISPLCSWLRLRAGMEASLQGTTFTPMASLPYSSHVRARGHAVLPILTARDAARHRQERPRRRERTLKPIQTTAAELWLDAASTQTTRSTNVLCALLCVCLLHFPACADTTPKASTAGLLRFRVWNADRSLLVQFAFLCSLEAGSGLSNPVGRVAD